MKILLAEDSKTSQVMISSYIKDAGHEIVIANNGQQAVDKFVDDRPDLVLMDVIMPVKDGVEAAQEIRELCEKENDWIPIIFLSAMSESKDIVRAIDAGGDDYLTKPIEAVVLNAKLKAMQRITEMRQQLQHANHELRMMAVIDGLTGIANRRHFDETIIKEVKRAVRNNTALSLMMADIDYFKPYNDNYGHQAGDDCLKYVAKTLAKVSKRPGDLVARYGGEEFITILPETGIEGAKVISEEMRAAISKLNFTHQYSQTADYLTISCGIATVQPNKKDDVKTISYKLLKEADKALYQAKANGRNQVFPT